MKLFKRTFLVLTFVLLSVIIVGLKYSDNPTPYQFPEIKFFPEMPVSVDNPVTVEGVELGRYLFYDPILSRDYSFSCSSCHKQATAFCDSPKKFSKGIDGKLMVRNTMPLFNLAWYAEFFWDGRARSIEDQVFHPVTANDEMDMDWDNAAKRVRESEFYQPKFKASFGEMEIDSILISKAIAQFERTLISNNSKYDRVIRRETVLTQEEYEGFNLINDQSKGDCLHCHTTDSDALGTTAIFSNNGLDAVFGPNAYTDKGKGGITGRMEDNGKFKIPSLRNLLFTTPYMHDGRFETLEEVLDFYSEGVNESYNIDSKMGSAHRGGVHLTKGEKQKIIAFLKTMSDSSFIENPKFGNPFIQE
ncbi:MAG: cytochrome-c peroxidase [Chlorobi bacterium]|nr:cytochrome-c peroxidase [Chlorobiota bacterium]